MPQHYSGIGAYYFWDGVEINDVRDFSPDRSIDTVEFTAGRDTDKSYGVTQKDVSGNFTYVTLGTDDTVKFYEGLYGTLEWASFGTVAGQPRYAFMAFVTGVSDPISYNGEETIDVSWQKSGTYIYNWAIEDDTY